MNMAIIKHINIVEIIIVKPKLSGWAISGNKKTLVRLSLIINLIVIIIKMQPPADF